MKQVFVLIVIVFFSCKNEKNATDIVESQEASIVNEVKGDMSLEIYDYDGLEPLINQKDEKVHVVNFWATWCAPCVKELPYFESINKDYKDKGVEVLLVSLDFPRNYDTKLKPFIKEYDIKSKVVVFDDTDQNRWIPAINEEWSGALPATIIYKGDKRVFYEKSFTQEELETELKQFLK